jgi:subtilisin
MTMRRTFIWIAAGVLAAGCQSGKSSDDGDSGDDGDGSVLEPPAPEDDVVDEAAGEDAVKVVKGEMPGVAIIVEFAEGLEVNATSEALADQFDLVITSRYHDLGGAAFIAPDEPTADQLQLDLRVAGIFRDRLVALSPGDAFDAEMNAAEADANAGGELEADERGEEEPGDPVPLSRMTPPLRSTGWRLVHGERAPSDGSGTRVAVLDTGIDMHHPDLADAVADNMGKDCLRRKNKTLYDFGDHGSHVSGIIAAQNNDFGTVGLAPGTRIVPLRVLDGNGEGTFSSILCGIDYVARRRDRIDVVNASLGAPCGGPCADGAPHHKALRNLVARGVTVVVSAGNEGIPADNADPAFVDEIITVSAYMDWNGAITTRDRYAHFSNFGPGVDIGAPGVRIWSTLPDERYARWNGTSMAAPFVAAAAAIIIADEGVGPEGVRERLLAAARSSYTGRGDDHPERLLLIPDGTGGCGDALCLGDETDESCPADCGCAASACDEDGPYGCSCEVDCEGDDCCADSDICPIM